MGVALESMEIFVIVCSLLCGVGFGALYLHRYLHLSYRISVSFMCVLSVALLVLIVSLSATREVLSVESHTFFGVSSHIVSLYLMLLVLFVMGCIDDVYLALPDSVLVVFFVLGCVYACSAMVSFALVWEHILETLALMGGVFVLRFFGEVVYKKPLLGEADIIVLGGIGLVFGVFFAFVSVFVASLLALVVGFFELVRTRRRAQAIPFVSYLFVGVLISYVGDVENLAQTILYDGVWNV